MYLELDDKISFTWGDQSVVSGQAAPPAGTEINFGSFRLTASPHLDTLLLADGLAVQFVRDGNDRISPYPSFHAGLTPHSVAAAERDFVSEAELIAQLTPPPFRLAFLADDGRLAPAAGAGQSISGSAFAEMSLQGERIFQSGALIMTFVDDRLGGYLNLSRPSGVASSWFDEADATEFVLADRTTIRLTGLIQGLARKVVGSAAVFGSPDGCLAA